MWSGQCRIEAIPAGGSGLPLRELRLSLDLRLTPDPAAPARAALLPHRRGRWLQAGLASLLLVGFGWWWQAGSPSSEAPLAPPGAPQSEATVTALPTPLAEPPPEDAALSPLPASRAPSIRPLAAAEAASTTSAAGAQRPTPAPATAAAPERRAGPGSPTARRSTPAPRAADADRLDLFGDTK